MTIPNQFSFGRNLMLFSLLFCFSIISLTAQQAAQFTGERVTTNYETELASIFTDYDIYDINSTIIADYVRNSKGISMSMNLELGDEYNWNMLVYENDLIGENYAITERTNNGDVTTSRGDFKTLSGYLQTAQGGSIGLTINNHFIFGTINNGDQSYFIEPLNGVIEGAAQDLYVVYNTKDAIYNPNLTCGVTDIAKYRITPKQTQALGAQMDECSIVEMALAADRSMFNKYGSVGGVEDYLVGIWNLVAPDYIGWFSQDIEFDIVTIFVVSGQDPWVGGTDASTLLDDFLSWGNNGGFGVSFDLGQIWTDRNITNDGNSGVVGLAYVGVVCTNAKYSLIEDFSGNSNAIRNTVSHEVGHNFDAVSSSATGHNNPPTGDIMDPSVNGATSWSAASIADISAHIDTRTCFEDCLQCIDISSVTVQNCGGGLYELEVCITHANRTNQSNLRISADGNSSNFSFNNTGEQCEMLFGLTANATANATLTVEDSNDGDVECNKTTTYNVPHPDCVCTSILSENFDAQTQPAGWANNVLGTNPNGRWEFADATYGVNTPAGSINGTGMAFWDDDAKDDTGTGQYDDNGTDHMELITPEMDITNFEFVTLDFDYNWWTFDGDDFFIVDVWDGNNWVNLLNTNETDCGAWGCTLPHFNVVVDDYANPNFQVRFTYFDSADSWQWHIAIDNVEVCGYQLAALPIDLVAFDGTEKDCTVELDWEIGDASSSDIFEIERSFDGQNFEVIGTINGLSSPNKTYNFTDINPGFENFYRLKTTTASGEINYSSIKSITATSCKEGALDIIEVFPNPTRGDLFYNIHSNDATEVTVEIRNAAGLLVDKSMIQLTTGMNNQLFDTDHLAKGMYYIQLTSNYGNSKVKKFVKN